MTTLETRAVEDLTTADLADEPLAWGRFIDQQLAPPLYAALVTPAGDGGATPILDGGALVAVKQTAEKAEIGGTKPTIAAGTITWETWALGYDVALAVRRSGLSTRLEDLLVGAVRVGVQTGYQAVAAATVGVVKVDPASWTTPDDVAEAVAAAWALGASLGMTTGTVLLEKGYIAQIAASNLLANIRSLGIRVGLATVAPGLYVPTGAGHILSEGGTRVLGEVDPALLGRDVAAAEVVGHEVTIPGAHTVFSA